MGVNVLKVTLNFGNRDPQSGLKDIYLRIRMDLCRANQNYRGQAEEEINAACWRRFNQGSQPRKI